MWANNVYVFWSPPPAKKSDQQPWETLMQIEIKN